MFAVECRRLALCCLVTHFLLVIGVLAFDPDPDPESELQSIQANHAGQNRVAVIPARCLSCKFCLFSPSPPLSVPSVVIIFPILVRICTTVIIHHLAHTAVDVVACRLPVR